MLEELEVCNLGPIRSAVLAPSAGMTAITGETGAGKSMLLSAIRLISGATANVGRVAAGADSAWAQGIFDVDENGKAAGLAQDAGVLDTDGEATDPDPDEIGRCELFLSRTVPASGRSRAVLCGHSVPRNVLGKVAAELVTIHGQADQLRLASPARQREFLDMAADDKAERESYRAAWEKFQTVDERLRNLTNQEASALQRADYLRESIEQINKVDPKPGEDEELKEKRSRVENAAGIVQGVSSALSALDASSVDSDNDAQGATDAINHAVQALRSIHIGGTFSEAAERLESLNADLSDIVFSLSNEMDTDEDAEGLDAINSRIHELDELIRRWGPTLEDVIAWRDKAAFEVEDLDASPEKLDELKAQREQAFDDAMKAAAVLSKKRKLAAAALAGSVTKELSALAMAGAGLEIRVVRRDAVSSGDLKSENDDTVKHVSSVWPLDATGIDDIEFLFTPFPGSPQLPMGKSASGGELSRLMLALELSVAEKRTSGSSDMTFIFDEVDAGVGGKAAVELGRRIAKLSQTSQVIVVTHLAQVASWADTQFVVSKGKAESENSGSKATVETTVNEVTGDARIHEIARMLSGSESATSLSHAKELLDSSRL
ncbi:DNA repair protein RecN [Bifidobacterium sp. ESL0682]|uniref:DNA repair protein RecN n=1 Tax=Bifidobacterium sp. ESL0682 TaxID=2983212 RepID=UPI0023FA0700|nr:DNA repair protein RecN [Bifidobacterium sp. ESL0682]WEV41394.1 DNA repair protein RecN [Bifidobacterium sp. ESL0682]